LPDLKLLSLAGDARARAEEILALAETYRDEGARQEMRKIAASYEELAQRLEEHASDG
jgi:hypothetical protein